MNKSRFERLKERVGESVFPELFRLEAELAKVTAEREMLRTILAEILDSAEDSQNQKEARQKANELLGPRER